MTAQLYTFATHEAAECPVKICKCTHYQNQSVIQSDRQLSAKVIPGSTQQQYMF